MYYRYYHDPGHHNTAAHYGVRTETHKPIHYWKQDQWELFDLTSDPHEQREPLRPPGAAGDDRRLKEELQRLKKEVKDDDQFATSQPPPGVDGNVPVIKKGQGK